MRVSAALVRQPDQAAGEVRSDARIRPLVRPLVRQPDQAAVERSIWAAVGPVVRPLVRQPDQVPQPGRASGGDPAAPCGALPALLVQDLH